MIIFAIVVVMVLHYLSSPKDAARLRVAGLLVGRLLRQVFNIVRVAAWLRHLHSNFEARGVVMERITPSNEYLLV